jgi:hypothetical protein
MGGNLNEFIIKIEFGGDGDVTGVRYLDQDGCGHEHAVYLDTGVDDLIQYHLKHYRESHDMTPRKRCSATLHVQVGSPLRCVHDPHGPETKHRFEVG